MLKWWKTGMFSYLMRVGSVSYLSFANWNGRKIGWKSALLLKLENSSWQDFECYKLTERKCNSIFVELLQGLCVTFTLENHKGRRADPVIYTINTYMKRWRTCCVCSFTHDIWSFVQFILCIYQFSTCIFPSVSRWCC